MCRCFSWVLLPLCLRSVVYYWLVGVSCEYFLDDGGMCGVRRGTCCLW